MNFIMLRSFTKKTYNINSICKNVEKRGFCMKHLLTSKELVKHMKSKGIKFEVMSELEAERFLSENNYYMKLASYRTIFKKHEKGSKVGQYINLDFAYLKDLSTIDMLLRYIIIEMCLDLEHAIKVRLLSEIEKNEEDDGYEIIRRFLCKGKNNKILDKIKGHQSSEYSKGLIEKYYPYFPVWVFVELISFGDLTYLCEFYKELYGVSFFNNKLMNLVRDIRNASAHSNCLINKLLDTVDSDANLDIEITTYVKSFSNIRADARSKNLRYKFTYNFITLIYMYDKLVLSEKTKEKRYKSLKDLFDNRMTQNKEYYAKHNQITSIYKFLKKIVDNL